MFADISALIAHNPPALHYGVAVADLDGGGAFAFVVAGFGGPNRVLKWIGGQLRDLAPPELADADRQAVGLAAGDLDGDGAEELYILNTDTYSGPKLFADRLFKRLPDGHWDDLFSRPDNKLARNLSAGRSVAVIDRRGVGRYGFFVANYARPMRLYELGPDGRLLDLAPSLELNATTGGRGLLAAPLLSDHTDLFCVNEQGPNLLFRNRGDGAFEECAAACNLTDTDEHARGVTAVDAGDGRLALCWGNWEGPHRLMVRQPDGLWKDRATAGLAFPSSVRTVIAADFDNDGHDEIFFNNIGEPNRLFRVSASPACLDPRDRGVTERGRGETRQPPVPTRSTTDIEYEQGADAPRSPEIEITMLDPGAALEPDSGGTGAAVADLDGDGVLELLVSHGESGGQPLSLYRARSAEGNGWLRIRPLTRFGAPARGALVRAECGGRVRVKLIDGGSGYLCQMEPVAHFGLGKERRVDRVTVIWPDGAELTMDDPDLNCTYSVPYPRG